MKPLHPNDSALPVYSVLPVTDEIIRGRRLTKQDDLRFLLQEDLEVLCAGADAIRAALQGDVMDYCTIINARSGRCGEDCRFCAQSACHRTQVEEYAFLPPEEILAYARQVEAAGIHRLSLVTAGRGLHGAELDRALEALRLLRRETDLHLCVSPGLQSLAEFQAMREAGAERLHANLETSRNFFPSICTTHTFQDKLDNLARGREAGLSLCSGGILGMGESWEDRIDMALTLSELGVTSIPLNILTPIPGTPLEGQKALTREEILRCVALFRYLNPEAWIRIAAGRNRFPDGGEILFRSGASAAITGDMLTTTGTGISDDLAMAEKLGRDPHISAGQISGR